MSGYCIILTTTDKQEIAEKIATSLIENDMAACVQIEEVKSYYKWENKFSHGDELRLMIKAKAKNYQQIEQNIVKLHNYLLPQIIKLDISEGLPAYLDWLGNKN